MLPYADPYTASVTDGVGVVCLWGNSYAVNLASLLPQGTRPRVLLIGAGDPRHILSCSASSVDWFIHESSPLTLARALLFLFVLNDATAGGMRDRAELFLSLYANILVRERDVQYVRRVAAVLVDVLTESGGKFPEFRKFVDFSCLKLRERDALQSVLERWRSCSLQSTAFHDRLVNFYKTRFDFRENLLDWQYQTVARLGCSVLHWSEYRRFGLRGVAFEPRLASCTVDNPTVMASRSRTALNDNAFPGDIGNCALSNLAKRAVHAQDQERLFRRVNGNLQKSTAAEVAEYNVLAWLARAEGSTFSLAPEKTEEREFPFLSPMAALTKVEEVEEAEISSEAFPLLRNFQDSRVQLLSGEMAAISRRGNFDVVFVGALASATLLQRPEEISRLLRPGSVCVVESLDNNALVDKQTKAKWRERVLQVAHSLAWKLEADVFPEDPELLVFRSAN